MQNPFILHVVLGLHWYQPHTQKKEILKRIVNKSYLPLLNALENIRCGSVACDISASLILQLAAEAPEVIEKFIALKKRGKLTLVNTAAYHPILPLVPQAYAAEQLKFNMEIFRKHGLISAKENVPGVFPPEMAFDEKLMPLLSGLGHEWIITDDTPYNTVHKIPTPATWIPQKNGVYCFLRSSMWSNHMSHDKPQGDAFIHELMSNFGKQFTENVYQAYVILWTDAETFGEHHPNAIEHFLKPFIRSKRTTPVQLVSPEKLLQIYAGKQAAIPAGSWSTSPSDLPEVPYAYWKNPKEEWHKLWWSLADLSLKIAEDKPAAKEYCFRALYSCQTWWWTLHKSKDLFLWAVPEFRKILEQGTPAQRKTGESLISRLS